MPHVSLEQHKKRAQYKRIRGHKIAYWYQDDAVTNKNQDESRDCQSRQVVLFIHGFPSAAWDWHHQWQALKADYRLLALDLLGYGLSDKPFPHQYSLLEQADIIETLLLELGINRCHILAHDYGDSVAQELLSRHYQQSLQFDITSVCFLNGGLFSDAHRPLFTQKILKGPLGPLVSRLMGPASLRKSFDKIFGPDCKASDKELNVLWQLLENNHGLRVVSPLLSYLEDRKVHGARWLDAMQNTKVPFCFFNGTFDPISGEHMAKRFEELLPDKQVRRLGVGHYPQLEAPELVTELYRDFIRAQRDPGKTSVGVLTAQI